MVNRRNLAILLLTFGLVRLGAAQVVIPVIVADSDGKTISGLVEGDFTVEPAKKVAVESVKELLPAGGPDAGHGPVYVLFDAASVGPPLQGRAQQRVVELLEKTAMEGEQVTLVMNAGRGLQLIHDASATSPEVLLAALRRVAKPDASAASGGSGDEAFTGKVEAEAARLRQLTGEAAPGGGLAYTFGQLSALQQMAASLRRLAGRKALVWITAHFPIEIDAELSYASMASSTHPELRDLSGAWEQTVEALNSAGVSVYPLQVEGPRPRDPIFAYAERTRYGLEELAQSTGGKSFTTQVDMRSAVKQAREDCGPYYLLGLHPASETKSVNWIKIRVSAGKARRIRAPRGLFLLPRSK